MSAEGEFIDQRFGLYEQYLTAEREAIGKYEANPLAFQQAATEEAREAQVEISAPMNGVLDVAQNVRVIPVPEQKITLPTPEGCVSKSDLIKLAREFGISHRSASIAWTRLEQRATHSITIPENGLTPEQHSRVAELQDAGIRIYHYQFEGESEKRLYFYTFKDKFSKDVELLRLHEGVEIDNPNSDDNERFLVASAFVKAIDEGWLEDLHEGEVEYYHSFGLGEKFKGLFQNWADRLRQGSLEIDTQDLSFGFATIEDIRDFAEQNGHNPSSTTNISRALNTMTAANRGKISRRFYESGYISQRYIDDDLFPPDPQDIPSIEVMNESGRIDLDVMKNLCYRGIFRHYGPSKGTQADKLVWAFLETKRKEALEALSKQADHTS